MLIPVELTKVRLRTVASKFLPASSLRNEKSTATFNPELSAALGAASENE